ncbi:hypothetical protein C5E45_29315 [Nocardia nova]|uniref:Uncharacterized protein n=1 Tax=Nocardia nova TaxID=37330 RepID=A0A2S6AHP0_9NOCA|nr:hypothetical protein [Nocardia nova]PPJ23137.1 hypothetical protein C5E41_25445 [Nocardia nova]PPJ34747.1 hypothetical protein C5E45_29315 [Nocardia nova]
MSRSVPDRTFVYADSVLAEVLCCAHLMELTPKRAEELRFIHRHHHPDECVVHLEAAYLLLIEVD